MCGYIERIDHHFRFIAEFSWEYGEDGTAADKLLSIIDKAQEGIDEKTFQGFYLTGQRKMIFFGQAASAESVQKLSAKVSRGNAVNTKISLAVHVKDFAEMLRKNFQTAA